MKVRRARRASTGGVIGLDLSLTGSAACFIPWGWEGDTRQLQTGKWGYPLTKDATPEDHVDRMIHIAEEVVDWCLLRQHSLVAVENYAFSQASTSATTLRELGGIVKREFRKRLGRVPSPVVASSARKTLLMKLPKANQKKFVEENVRRLKGEALYWTGDEVDAFVVCNHAMMLAGGVPLSFEGKV